MFSFLYSQERKMRQNAENWLEIAGRVRHFRSDLLTDTQNQRLATAAGELRQRLKEKADAGKVKLAIEELERILRDTGGRIYPASSLVENVEFFLVAAIVILGLRAYFVQPFKIPTNSMWPSYYGMTGEVFQPGQEPGTLRKAARLLTLGATNYAVTAPADGEVMIPVFSTGFPAISEKRGRSLLVFPAVLREFTFAVGGQLVKLSVPAEFDQEMTWLRDSFFKGQAHSAQLALLEAGRKLGTPESSTLVLQQDGRQVEARVFWIPTGKRVKRGDNILSFDILTGDLLFVERLSYNFIRPQVGSGFVFRTENIKSPQMLDANGRQIRQYYVKRLVGVPGDVMEIKAPALYRNGKPIEGSDAFGKNARREGLYPGYTNNATGPVLDDGVQAADGSLPPGRKLTVPADSFFALGDNSPNSKDSRFWGFIPEKEVVGRPLFIYYPLTSRWGPAR